MELKTIGRNVKKAFSNNEYVYGTDLKGNYFKLKGGTMKKAGTIDEYELVLKWNKIQYMSYEKMEVISIFNQI
jgi:hypothetical protein